MDDIDSEIAAPRPGAEPCVGIFWLVPTGGTPVLVSDRVPLAQAETYGDCLTYPRGHYEVWEEWRQLGASGLIRRGLPPIIADFEYEVFPRGRVVCDLSCQLFTIYADRKLFDPDIVAQIEKRFGLQQQFRSLQSDDHYRT